MSGNGGIISIAIKPRAEDAGEGEIPVASFFNGEIIQ
jgi:hypothetical protein